MPQVEVTVRNTNIDVIVNDTISVEAGTIQSDVSSVAGKTGAVSLEIEDITGLEDALSDIQSGGDKNYLHDQIAASTTWTIAHNLNKLPSVIIIDSGGSQVVGDVNYVDSNNVTLTFSVAFSGRATLN